MELILSIFLASFYVLATILLTLAVPVLIIGFFLVSVILIGETVWSLFIEYIKNRRKKNNEET